MDIVCVPSGIVDLERPRQGIMDIARAGFKNVLLDMSMCCLAGTLENVGENGQEEHTKQGQTLSFLEYTQRLHNRPELMLDRCRKENLKTPIGRAPYLLRNTKRRDLGELMVRLAQESIRIFGQIGCQYIVVRPLSCDGKQIDGETDTGALVSGPEGWITDREYFLRLASTARENSVIILLENQCRQMNGRLVRGFCADGFEAASWVDALNRAVGEERFGFCMDTGVCSHCGQDMRDFVLSLGRRIKAVLLRDCNGHTEDCMLPFTSVSGGKPRTDWLSLIRGLRETEFDGKLMIDFSDTAGSFSPILRPGLIVLARSVAEYFKWQVEIEDILKKYRRIVLFGAGNMCRNYMKCYGDKYPPLFTCDNNQELWGTRFCGLEVRPPSDLVELPQDCAIFICNIYYREIEAQLLNMGIWNPIEFFNDEYMPSFYYNRLERNRR